MERNYFGQTLLILAAAAALLLVYPLLHSRSPWLQSHFRDYDFFGTFLQKNNHPTDSLTETGDTTAVFIPVDTTYTGFDALAGFFNALANGKEQIRIAYYGDSSIEGDLISQTVRDSLQRRFGGKGVGYVPITTHVQGFRRSVRQSFSGNWYTCKVVVNNYRKLPRGISGEYFTVWSAPQKVDTLATDSTRIDTTPPAPVERGHWASFGSTRLNPGTRIVPSARLFYGLPKGDTLLAPEQAFVSVRTGSEERQKYELLGASAVNELWLTQQPCDKVRIDVSAPSSMPFYGVSLESNAGVIVDNFSARGNSGALLTNIPSNVLKGFQEKLDYDLIILQYGLNVLNPEMKNYQWYEKEMVNVIHHFQQNMPGVPILVIGVSDKGTRIDGVMQTDPSIPRITAAQQRAAEQTGSAFMSLFSAMGGEGSMITWVEKEQPRLANLDYAHFNFEGAEKAGRMLIRYLMDGYSRFIQNKHKNGS